MRDVVSPHTDNLVPYHTPPSLPHTHQTYVPLLRPLPSPPFTSLSVLPPTPVPAQRTEKVARCCRSSVRGWKFSLKKISPSLSQLARQPEPVRRPCASFFFRSFDSDCLSRCCSQPGPRVTCTYISWLLLHPTISRLSTLVYRPCFFLPPSFFRLPPAFFLLRLHRGHAIVTISHVARRIIILCSPVLCCALGEYEPSDDDEVEEIEEVSDFLRQLHVGHHKDKHLHTHTHTHTHNRSTHTHTTDTTEAHTQRAQAVSDLASCAEWGYVYCTRHAPHAAGAEATERPAAAASAASSFYCLMVERFFFLLLFFLLFLFFFFFFFILLCVTHGGVYNVYSNVP